MERKRWILGITGGVGSGKSTALEYLRTEYGAELILLDQEAGSLQRPGAACYAPMLELLGEETLDADGYFDRKRVAEMVFSDPALLRRLNAIIHPAVKQSVLRRIEELRTHPRPPLTVIEAALLFEDHYDEVCDEIWYVYAPEQVRARRLALSRGYTKERICRMMEAQQKDEYYRMRADLVIDNGGPDFADTRRQIDEGLYSHGFLYDSQRQQR